MTKLPLFFAQTAPAPASGGFPTSLLLTYVLFFGAMYFLFLAPQRKKQKEHEKKMASLAVGDEIITTGGIYGTITSVKDDRYVIRVGESQKLEISKGFIHACVKPPAAA